MKNKQKEQLKKGLVFGGLGLLCALSMWFIFAPSGKDKSAAQQGLNDSIPQATTEQLTDNKLKAYELGDKLDHEEQAREEMGRLSDYFAESTEPSDAERAEIEASTAKIETSMHRYEENTRLLNSFYAPDPNEEEREALRAEIEDLRRELREKDSDEEDEEEKQLALMEKSYQMAAKYLPQTSATPSPLSNAFAEAKERSIVELQTINKTAEPVMEVLTERKQIVSSLEQPMTDKEFMEEYGTKPRNLGFHSLATTMGSPMRNTLKVVVDRTTTLQEGDYVALRLLETARIKDTRIPKQSKLIAQAKMEGNRMQLHIKSIEIDGQIMPVKTLGIRHGRTGGCVYPQL